MDAPGGKDTTMIEPLIDTRQHSQITMLHTKRDAAIKAMHQLAPTWKDDATALALHVLRIAGIIRGQMGDPRCIAPATEWARVALECAETQRAAEDNGDPLKGYTLPGDVMLAGRIRKALARRYRFWEPYGTMALGDFLAAVTPTKRSEYIRHYARKKRNGCYANLARPKHEYTIHYSHGRWRHGVEVPKIIYDAFDHLPAVTYEESHN